MNQAVGWRTCQTRATPVPGVENHAMTQSTPPATNAISERRVLEERGTFQHTFAEAGPFDYACAIHPGMTGTVTVTA